MRNTKTTKRKKNYIRFFNATDNKGVVDSIKFTVTSNGITYYLYISTSYPVSVGDTIYVQTGKYNFSAKVDAVWNDRPVVFYKEQNIPNNGDEIGGSIGYISTSPIEEEAVPSYETPGTVDYTWKYSLETLNLRTMPLDELKNYRSNVESIVDTTKWDIPTLKIIIDDIIQQLEASQYDGSFVSDQDVTVNDDSAAGVEDVEDAGTETETKDDSIDFQDTFSQPYGGGGYASPAGSGSVVGGEDEGKGKEKGKENGVDIMQMLKDYWYIPVILIVILLLTKKSE